MRGGVAKKWTTERCVVGVGPGGPVTIFETNDF